MRRVAALAAALALVASPARSLGIVAADGTALIEKARACVEVDGDRWCVERPGEHERGPLALRLTVDRVSGGGAGVRVRLALANRGEAAIAVDALEPLRGARPVLPGEGAVRALVDGWTMNILPQLVVNGEAAGHGVAAVERAGRAIALGAHDEAAEVRVEWQGGELDVRHELGAVEIAPGDSIAADLWIAHGSSLSAALGGWSGFAFSGRGPAPRPLTGWCSWYAMPRPTEAFVLREASIARSLGLEVVQIDDGWQRRAGEWEANASYPRGMAATAADLRAAGAVPGLWLAPFIAAEDSPVVRAHPDWVLRDGEGRPVRSEDRPAWGGRVVALDPSVPGLQRWLAALARRVTHDWGYAYLKLDFVGWGIDDARSDRTVTPVAAYRAALAAMRAAAAPGTYILGCDAPFAASVGLFDAIRTGPDASAEPPREAQTLTASLRRQHWRRAYALDSDVVMVRAGLSDADALARAYFPVVTGGALFSGDALIALDAERRALLAGAAAARSADGGMRLRLGRRLTVAERRDDEVTALIAVTADRAVEVDGGPAVVPPRLVDPVAARAAPTHPVGAGTVRLLLERPNARGRWVFDPARPLARIPAEEVDAGLRIGPFERPAELLVVPPARSGPLEALPLAAGEIRVLAAPPPPGGSP